MLAAFFASACKGDPNFGSPRPCLPVSGTSISNFDALEVERGRLVHRFRTGSEPQALAELARVELRAGLLGSAAAHAAYAASLDRQSVLGDEKLCAAMVKEVKALAQTRAFALADRQWRRIQAICPNLRTSWPSPEGRKALARAAQCELSHLAIEPVRKHSVLNDTLDSNADEWPLVVRVATEAGAALPAWAQALHEIYAGNFGFADPALDRESLHDGYFSKFDANGSAEQVAVQQIRSAAALGQKMREWTREGASYANPAVSSDNASDSKWLAEVWAFFDADVRSVLAQAIADSATLRHSSAAAKLVEACEADPIPGVNCGLALHLLSMAGHIPYLKQLASRWTHTLDEDSAGSALIKMQLALILQLDGRAERWAGYAAAQSLAPVTTWNLAADLAATYRRFDVERACIVRWAAHDAAANFRLMRRILALDLLHVAHAQPNSTQKHVREGLAARFERHLRDPQAQGNGAAEFQRIVGLAVERGLREEGLSNALDLLEMSRRWHSTPIAGGHVVDVSQRAEEMLSTPTIIGRALIGPPLARLRALRIWLLRVPPKHRVAALRFLSAAQPALLPKWDAHSGLSLEVSPLIANAQELLHVVSSQGAQFPSWSTPTLSIPQLDVDRSCDPGPQL
jgi:hypothetical protein